MAAPKINPVRPDASSSRLHAGRIAVIADEQLADQLRTMTDHDHAKLQIVQLPSYLALLGQLAHQPVDAVVGPISEMTGMAAATARALRRMVPQAKLIVLAEQRDQALAAAVVDAGFDACLLTPVHPESLAKELQINTLGHQDDPLTALRRRQDGSAEPVPAPAQAVDPGDVDLLRSLLGHRAAFRATTLKIITQHAKLPEVQWVADRSQVPLGHHHAPIHCQGRSFGLLHAKASHAADCLPGWAAWLGHWLSLEDYLERVEELAMRDELTGLWNRRYFNTFLKDSIANAENLRSQVTLLLFDIDDFKLYNDTYGHSAGDEILEGIGRLMQSVVRDHDVVARIGGDEFGVIFWDAEQPRRPNSRHPQDVLQAAKRFQQAVCSHRFPKLLNQAMGTLTISGGLASFPWDGRTPQELMERADAMALTSKRQGKNVITFGPGAQLKAKQDAGPTAAQDDDNA